MNPRTYDALAKKAVKLFTGDPIMLAILAFVINTSFVVLMFFSKVWHPGT